MAQSKGAAVIDCLHTVQRSLNRSWRASAWLLEHICPEEIGPPRRRAHSRKFRDDFDDLLDGPFSGNLSAGPEPA